MRFGVLNFVKNKGKKLLIKPTILNRSEIVLGGHKDVPVDFHDNISQIMMFRG